MGQVARVGLAAAIALAACGDSGVSVEVDVGTTGATSVELFIASQDPCDGCDALAGPGDDRPLAGSVFFRDPDATFAVDASGGSAVVNLKPGSGDNDVRTIVIVGLAGDQVVGASVLQSFHVGGDARRVLVTLEAANEDPLDDATPSADPFRVQLWRKTTEGKVACVGIEHWEGDELAGRKFVVPEEDPDCDDFEADAECRPFQYKAEGRPDAASYTCLDSFPVGTGQACMLGGPECIDGQGAGNECGPTVYCLPEPVCSTTCAANQPACLADQLATVATGLSHIECVLPIAPDNGGEVLALCGPEIVPVTMGPEFSDANRTCTSALLGRLRPPLALGASMDIQARMPTTTDKLRVKVASSFHAACGFDLSITGTIEPMTTQLETGAVDLALDNGQHLILPVHFTLSSDCAQPQATCTAVFRPTATGPVDSIVHCIE